jgi:hypothetical protein
MYTLPPANLPPKASLRLGDDRPLAETGVVAPLPARRLLDLLGSGALRTRLGPDGPILMVRGMDGVEDPISLKGPNRAFRYVLMNVFASGE